MHKNNRQNSENDIFYKKRNLCREVYSRPPVYQIWRIYLDLWGHDCKKYVWPTFGCKLGHSDPIVMQLKLDMSCHLLNVYTKCQIDISKHVEEKSGKPGRKDGQTLPRHNTSRFSNGRIKIIGGVKGQGHIVYPVLNRCTPLLFHVNWINHSWDMANSVLDYFNTSWKKPSRISPQSNQVLSMTYWL